MNKHIKRAASLLMAAVVLAVLTITCGAVDIKRPAAALEDYQHSLSGDEQSEILELIQDTADKIGMNVGIIIADDLGGIDEEEYCEVFSQAHFIEREASIVLLLAEEGSGDYDWLYTTGAASEIYDQQLDKIFDAVYYGLDSGVSPNYKAASEQFCSYLTDNMNGYSGSDPKDYSSISYKATLDDYQYVLSSSEKVELLEVIQSTANTIGANVGVVLSDSLNGKSEERYTDDYMYEQFGKESSSIVLMLVKEGTGNQDTLALNKHAFDIYDSQYEDILDAVYRGMDSGNSPNYPAAIKKFCSYLENHQTGYVGSSGKTSSFRFGFGHLVMLVFALIISIVSVGTYAAGYKKKAPVSARAYLAKDSTRFTIRQDIFVREYTTSHRISSSSGGSHHGGGGGHSRSGGHSSHGGRHR